MERQRPKEEQKPSEQKLEELRRELTDLRERKKQKELMEKHAAQIIAAVEDNTEVTTSDTDLTALDDIETRLDKIDAFLIEKIGQQDEKTYEQHSQYIETELKTLENEIIEEKGILEADVSPYEKIMKDYPWLDQPRYEFMYTIPDKKKNPTDYESWKKEWAKVVFDYARYAILHILYVRKLNAEKPFSKFIDRENSIREIAEELIGQKLAIWLSKKEGILRLYWKTLEGWADEIYNWAYELGKLDPIMMYELKEAKREFSNLPKEDIEAIFKILAKEKRANIIKIKNGELSLKIRLD